MFDIDICEAFNDFFFIAKPLIILILNELKEKSEKNPMFQFLCLIFAIFPSSLSSKYLILSQNKYPYVICDSSTSGNVSGLEPDLLRMIFQQMNMQESQDFEFICSDSSFNFSQLFFAKIGGLSRNQNNFNNYLELFPKSCTFLLIKKFESYFYSNIINVGFYGVFFVIPLLVGVLIFLLSDSELNVFYHVWASYRDMFFLKRMINMKRNYLILFQSLLRYFLLGLLLSGILNFLLNQNNLFPDSISLKNKNVGTTAEFFNVVTEKNAIPMLLDDNFQKLQTVITNSEENSLFCVDYLWGLQLQNGLNEKINIFSTLRNVNSTFLQFMDFSDFGLISKMMDIVKTFKKKNIPNNLIQNNFQLNNVKKPKQIDKFSLLWIILGVVLLSIALWKTIRKLLKKPFSFFYRNHFKTVDLLKLRKEMDQALIEEGTKILGKISRQSLEIFKHVKSKFMKRQFRTNINPKEQMNLMFLNVEVNKDLAKTQILAEAQKTMRILEEGKFYESEKFLKKRKKKISILKSHPTDPTIANMAQKKKSIIYQDASSLRVQKAKTLYEVIRENIKNTVQEKKITLQDLIEEDKIIESLPPSTNNGEIKDVTRKRSFKSFQNALNSKRLSNEQKLKKPTFMENYSFKEDTILKEEEEKRESERRNTPTNLHNLPYVSPTHNMLVNSNISILENFKKRHMNKEKKGEYHFSNKILEMEEEEKMSSISKGSRFKIDD